MLSASNYRAIRATTLLILATVVALFYFSNNTIFWPLPCLFKMVTGWNCWGCGGQHAFREILHGHWAKAFELNALIFPVLFLFGYMLIMEVFATTPSYRIFHKRYIQITAIVLLFGYTFLRNII